LGQKGETPYWATSGTSLRNVKKSTVEGRYVGPKKKKASPRPRKSEERGTPRNLELTLEEREGIKKHEQRGHATVGKKIPPKIFRNQRGERCENFPIPKNVEKEVSGSEKKVSSTPSARSTSR